VAPRRRDLGLVVAVGAMVAVVGWVRPDGIGGGLVALAAVVALVGHGRLVNRQAVVLAAAAVPFAVALVLHTSWWVVPLDLAVGLVLVLAAASYGRGGTVVDTAPLDLLVRAGRAVASAVLSVGHTRRIVRAAVPAGGPRGRRRLRAVGRGLLLAVPVVVALAALLAAGDAVFSSVLRLPVDLDDAAGRVVLLVLGGLAVATLLREADEPPLAPEHRPWQPLGATEAVVVLGGLVVVFTAFVATQVVTAAGGAEHVLRTAGLTRAEYARTGFFQLLGAVGLTVVVLVGVRALAAPTTSSARGVVRALGLTAVVLTLAVVGVAVVRLRLYEDAYGTTMLRLASTATAWWLGAVMVLVGIAFAGAWSHRRWLTLAVSVSAVVAVAGWTVADPEVVVAGRNLARAEAIAGGQVPPPPPGEPAFDVGYALQLGDDAVPTLIDGLDRLTEPDAARLRAGLCTRRPPPRSWAAANLAAADADRARAATCGS
jgi:hypothetical protein